MNRAILMIVASLLIALFAVVIASRWISEKANLSTRKIVVAATDISLGTRLSPEMLRITEWPAESVQTDSFNDIKQLDTRVTKINLQSGEPVNESKLAQRGATGGLSALVAEGKRAMTVRVNDVVGVAGFALPGNFVDILVSTQDETVRPAGKDLSISKLVLERILVLAVAQEASQSDTKPKVVSAVTLEVTPEQAEKLDLARSVGQLSLVLRNQIDMTPAQTTGATKHSLLSASPVVVATSASAPTQAPEKIVVPRKKIQNMTSDSSTSNLIASGSKVVCQEIMTGNGRIRQCQ